jgi:predicted nucleotidyltransferase
MRDWENQFREWAKPPGITEEERIKNAERVIRDALKSYDALENRNISVLTHGSYRNNTNVRVDSDIDIAVVCHDVFFHDYPKGTTKETFGNIDGDYSYEVFKNEVEDALVARFGRTAVKRGNKAFDVHENTYRVEADVAPFFEHRRYSTDGKYLIGVELRPDDEKPPKIINWPKQHHENGISKNSITGKKYKSIVRVLKCLRNEMFDNNFHEANPIPGFLLECLVWNVPNNYFSNTSYISIVKNCLAFLFNNTIKYDTCSEWGEVSELKYLFRPTQKWTWQQTHSFLSKAWDYIGLE